MFTALPVADTHLKPRHECRRLIITCKNRLNACCLGTRVVLLELAALKGVERRRQRSQSEMAHRQPLLVEKLFAVAETANFELKLVATCSRGFSCNLMDVARHPDASRAAFPLFSLANGRD